MPSRERDKIDFMMGALSSRVAAPLSDLAQRYGIIYFNSNSSADTVTNEKCHRTNVVWDANNWMFFSKRWANAPIPVPDNVSCNGYLAARELLRAVERAGTTKNHDVIKALEGHVKDNFRKYPSTIRPWDHLVGQMLYLARRKKEADMKAKWDMIEMIADIAPELAAPPQAISKCKMEPLADTPVYGG